MSKKNTDKRLKNLISLYVSDILYEKIIQEKDSPENPHNSINSLLNEILEKHYNLYGKSMENRTIPQHINKGIYDSWYAGVEADETMQKDHLPLFLVMIDRMVEKDLTGKTVLDFGCNQGLFLRVLYQIREFDKGYGIDLIQKSIDIANSKITNQPIEYLVANNLTQYHNNIDIVFSHEVLYTLPDLKKHVDDISSILKNNGVYYVVIGRHTDNPLWNRWKGQLSESSADTIQDYSLDDIYDTFENNGFECFVQKFMLNDFMRIKKKKYYFNKIKEGLDYYWDYKVLFRFVKKN
jgi:2-polyprenyl-3-methyl-5-hydroxy-6-metoxy-1,4-benzoquinol methylase